MSSAFSGIVSSVVSNVGAVGPSAGSAPRGRRCSGLDHDLDRAAVDHDLLVGGAGTVGSSTTSGPRSRRAERRSRSSASGLSSASIQGIEAAADEIVDL